MRQKQAAWAVALVLLAAALVFFNLPGARVDAGQAEPAAQTSDIPVGHEPGERLPEIALQTMDGGAFALSEQRGCVTIINLWATWCTPCVNELPHFDRLQREHADEVTVLAIHSDLITDDPAAYLSAFDYDIAFAVDSGGEAIAAVGGSTMLPQTVVVDKNGVVTYNKVGSVTYEALEELLREAESGF